jgi:hypothetical protein
MPRSTELVSSSIRPIDGEHDLPIARQVEALNISRGSFYYLPRPVKKLVAERDREIEDEGSCRKNW